MSSPETFAAEIVGELRGQTVNANLVRSLADRIAERDRVLAGHYRAELPTLTGECTDPNCPGASQCGLDESVPDTERAPYQTAIAPFKRRLSPPPTPKAYEDCGGD